jgi:hypothetical protein
MISRYFPCEKANERTQRYCEVRTYMSAGIVVAESLGTAETFQQRVRSQNHILDLLDAAVLTSRNGCDVLHDSFRSLRLSCARLAGYNDALVFMIGIHVVICAFSDTEHMGRHLEPILALVSPKNLVCVYPKICSSVSSFWNSLRCSQYL